MKIQFILIALFCSMTGIEPTHAGFRDGCGESLFKNGPIPYAHPYLRKVLYETKTPTGMRRKNKVEYETWTLKEAKFQFQTWEKRKLFENDRQAKQAKRRSRSFTTHEVFRIYKEGKAALGIWPLIKGNKIEHIIRGERSNYRSVVTVEGDECRSTPFGRKRLAVIKTHSEGISGPATGGVIDTTYYFSPSLGIYVKKEQKVVSPDGSIDRSIRNAAIYFEAK